MESTIKKIARKDQQLIRKNLQSLREFLVIQEDDDAVEVSLGLLDKANLVLPVSTLKIFEILLDKLARERQFFILSEDEELTTQQAAEILNVSRPFVVKQVESGEIPHKKVGSHRRLLLKDILAYEKRIQVERNKALQELADLAQKHNMGY